MAESTARTNREHAQALLTLASELHARGAGRVQREAAILVRLATSYMARFDNDPTAEAIARIGRCRVLASRGVKPKLDEIWSLVFTEAALYLRSVDRSPSELIRFEYGELTDLELCDAAPYRSYGAAERAFGAAGARPYGHDIGIAIRTASAEIVLGHRSEATLLAWSDRLQPALTKLGPKRVRRLVTVPRCRLCVPEQSECREETLSDLIFTEHAVFLRGARVITLEYDEITDIYVGEHKPARSRARTAGGGARKAIVAAAHLLGAPRIVRSEPLPSTEITLRTTRGDIVLVHQSLVPPAEWRQLLWPVLDKLNARSRQRSDLAAD